LAEDVVATIAGLEVQLGGGDGGLGWVFGGQEGKSAYDRWFPGRST
jgi:hypothetical protein